LQARDPGLDQGSGRSVDKGVEENGKEAQEREKRVDKKIGSAHAEQWQGWSEEGKRCFMQSGSQGTP